MPQGSGTLLCNCEERMHAGGKRGAWRDGHRGGAGGVGGGLCLDRWLALPRAAIAGTVHRGAQAARRIWLWRPAEPRQGCLRHRHLQATGAAAAVSRATLFQPGTYPLVGRFSLGSAEPTAPDATTRVRGFAFDVVGPGGAEWRSANIDAPFFPVATPAAFLQLLQASGSKDPDALGKVAAAHPELRRSAPGRRRLHGPRHLRKNAITGSTPSWRPTAPATGMPCAGRCCLPPPCNR